MLDWLLWWQQRRGPASDWLHSVLHEYVGEEDLEVMHQAGNQVMPLSDIHFASFDVWVRDLGYHKVPALSPRCIWHMGTTQDLEDTVYVLAMCQMQKSEEPLVVHRFLTWWLIDHRRLRLFGHIARSSPREDHRALAACIQVPPDWKRPAERPSHTWLRAIEADCGPLNFGLATVWRKATTRDEWRHIVDTAMLQRSMLWKKKPRFAGVIPERLIFRTSNIGRKPAIHNWFSGRL